MPDTSENTDTIPSIIDEMKVLQRRLAVVQKPIITAVADVMSDNNYKAFLDKLAEAANQLGGSSSVAQQITGFAAVHNNLNQTVVRELQNIETLLNTIADPNAPAPEPAPSEPETTEGAS